MPLLADPVRLREPASELLIDLISGGEPEGVNDVAGRVGADPPEPGAVDPPGQHKVPIQSA